MAETLGLIASVIQVAGAGLKLSQTLYQYVDGVATADRRIKDIAKEIRLTSFVIEELGDVFKNDDTSALMSKNAVKTAEETMKECSSVFTEIDATLKKSKNNTLGRLMLPFRDNKIELLRTHIDKLKSTLQLLMQVLTHAHQVAAKKLDREAEEKQKAQIQELIELKKESTKKYEASLRNFSMSDDSTLNDDPEAAPDEKDEAALSMADLTIAAVAIGSTINPKTLETCVNHIRTLLENIETLQQALTNKVEGDDHSQHHQSLVGSYFQARGHLDSVLLGGSHKLGVPAARENNVPVKPRIENTPSITPERQLPIKFKDTFGRTYCFSFQACRTWEGLHSRIKGVYRRVAEWRMHIACTRFDLTDENGTIIMEEDWNEVAQPGMTLNIQFWPNRKPHVSTEQSDDNEGGWDIEDPESLWCQPSDSAKHYGHRRPPDMPAESNPPMLPTDHEDNKQRSDSAEQEETYYCASRDMGISKHSVSKHSVPTAFTDTSGRELVRERRTDDHPTVKMPIPRQPFQHDTTVSLPPPSLTPKSLLSHIPQQRVSTPSRRVLRRYGSSPNSGGRRITNMKPTTASYGETSNTLSLSINDMSFDAIVEHSSTEKQRHTTRPSLRNSSTQSEHVVESPGTENSPQSRKKDSKSLQPRCYPPVGTDHDTYQYGRSAMNYDRTPRLVSYYRHHTSSTSNYTGSSRVPSLYITNDPDLESPRENRRQSVAIPFRVEHDAAATGGAQEELQHDERDEEEYEEAQFVSLSKRQRIKGITSPSRVAKLEGWDAIDAQEDGSHKPTKHGKRGIETNETGTQKEEPSSTADVSDTELIDRPLVRQSVNQVDWRNGKKRDIDEYPIISKPWSAAQNSESSHEQHSYQPAKDTSSPDTDDESSEEESEQVFDEREECYQFSRSNSYSSNLLMRPTARDHADVCDTKDAKQVKFEVKVPVPHPLFYQNQREFPPPPLPPPRPIEDIRANQYPGWQWGTISTPRDGNRVVRVQPSTKFYTRTNTRLRIEDIADNPSTNPSIITDDMSYEAYVKHHTKEGQSNVRSKRTAGSGKREIVHSLQGDNVSRRFSRSRPALHVERNVAITTGAEEQVRDDKRHKDEDDDAQLDSHSEAQSAKRTSLSSGDSDSGWDAIYGQGEASFVPIKYGDEYSTDSEGSGTRQAQPARQEGSDLSKVDNKGREVAYHSRMEPRRLADQSESEEYTSDEDHSTSRQPSAEDLETIHEQHSSQPAKRTSPPDVSIESSNKELDVPSSPKPHSPDMPTHPTASSCAEFRDTDPLKTPSLLDPPSRHRPRPRLRSRHEIFADEPGSGYFTAQPRTNYSPSARFAPTPSLSHDSNASKPDASASPNVDGYAHRQSSNPQGSSRRPVLPRWKPRRTSHSSRSGYHAAEMCVMDNNESYSESGTFVHNLDDTTKLDEVDALLKEWTTVF